MSSRQKHRGTSVKPASAPVERAVRLFSADRRNAIRGLVAAARRAPLTSEQIDVVRANRTEQDMVAAATVLETPGGLRGRKIHALLQEEICAPHSLRLRPSELEVAYACGFLNCWKADALVAVETIAVLSQLTAVPTKDAIGAVLKTAETWGASNYLILKLAYLKEFSGLDDEDEQTISAIDECLGNRQSPFMQYYAMESLKSKISIFSVARRHTNTLMDRIDGNFRRFHSLNNLVATPISEADCAGFVLRAVETSLIDTVRCLWTIANLKSRVPGAFLAIERNLEPEIYEALIRSQVDLGATPVPQLWTISEEVAPEGDQSGADEERSLAAYRRSIAFLEFPLLCQYRQDLDRVIGHRLVAPVLPEIGTWHADSFDNLSILRQPDGKFVLEDHDTSAVAVDLFYRTYLFLRFIQKANNLARLSSEDVEYIFDNTTRLEALLLERELKTMHLNASDDARALISVLALALYRGKSSDPDIDFDFRAKLEEYIIKHYDGRIVDFIDSIAPKSPEVANYIASSLDEVTLQKMYQLISSSVEAENARRDILTSVGIHLNNIDFIIEAEAIETRSKVAKLKNYFDASRMYVDSIAMKKWLGSNPSAYTEQYKELLPKITARVSTSAGGSGKDGKLDFVKITSTDAFLVERIATDAFREFCINNEFGIESYLGRRIRHNTLHGVMTKSVDAVLQRQEYHPIIAGTPFGAALRTWESGYKVYIERMRKEFLQFKTDGRPHALFNSEIDFSDIVTKRNLQLLVQSLRISGAELLDELIISFCWRQIGPQLESASRQIRVKMTQDVTQHLDQVLQKFHGPEEVKIKHALQDAITSVFAQVASWFQLPQTGFVPASIPEICNIIDIEHGRTTPTIVIGNRENTSYYGISVHRLYDCLAVLLQNAFKHGRPGTDVVVRMSTEPIEATNLHVLDVAVQSILPRGRAGDCVNRVSQALTSSETSKDMVTEGYSGIKKVKFITRLNEGVPTVAFDILDEAIEVRFRLKVEVAEKEVDD